MPTPFDEFVQRQQKEQEEEASFGPKQLEQWLGYLDALYEQIRGYLQTYIENGSAKIDFREIQLNEDFIGAYTAQEMHLNIGRSNVIFTPIGTMLIGTKGRVDVVGPAGRARLTLINKNVTDARQLIQVRVSGLGRGKPRPPVNRPLEEIEWVWKIVSSPPQMHFTELTQEAFFEMVLEVANA